MGCWRNRRVFFLPQIRASAIFFRWEFTKQSSRPRLTLSLAWSNWLTFPNVVCELHCTTRVNLLLYYLLPSLPFRSESFVSRYDIWDSAVSSTPGQKHTSNCFSLLLGSWHQNVFSPCIQTRQSCSNNSPTRTSKNRNNEEQAEQRSRALHSLSQNLPNLMVLYIHQNNRQWTHLTKHHMNRSALLSPLAVTKSTKLGKSLLGSSDLRSHDPSCNTRKPDTTKQNGTLRFCDRSTRFSVNKCMANLRFIKNILKTSICLG